jgi:hypothetical protein
MPSSPPCILDAIANEIFLAENKTCNHEGGTDITRLQTAMWWFTATTCRTRWIQFPASLDINLRNSVNSVDQAKSKRKH